MDRELAMRLLDAAGYEVRGRGIEWREVLAVGEDTFRGEGRTDDEAFDDLMRKMLPSHLAMRCASLALDVLVRLDAAPEPPADVEPCSHRPGGEATLQGSCADCGTDMDDEPIAPQDEAPAASSSDVAWQPTSGPPAEEPVPRVDVYAEIVRLDEMLAERACLEGFAVLSADKQRLTLLGWMARCRALEAQAPDDRRVASRGAAIARRLNEFARQFWPGTVMALRMSARPEDVAIGARGEARPTTWDEVVIRAWNARHADDGDGWADNVRLVPPPADPDALFTIACACARALESASPVDDALRATALQIARELRWLRLVAPDPVAWGIAMGHVRRFASTLSPTPQDLRRVLDASYTPPVPWAELCLPKVDADAERERQREAHLADLLDASDDPARLLGWLVRAIDLWTTPELAVVVTPVREAVLAVIGSPQGPADPREDSRVRRRLLALGREMTKPSAPAPSPSPPPPSEPPIAPEDPLLRRVREKLSARACGRPALLVSNVADGDLAETLGTLLGVRVETSDGSVRRVQAQCERITNGSYGLILSATGFQLHAVDSTLSRAAARAGVLYVRVNRGRPTATVQALARDLGIAG